MHFRKNYDNVFTTKYIQVSQYVLYSSQRVGKQSGRFYRQSYYIMGRAPEELSAWSYIVFIKTRDEKLLMWKFDFELAVVYALVSGDHFVLAADAVICFLQLMFNLEQKRDFTQAVYMAWNEGYDLLKEKKWNKNDICVCYLLHEW